MRRTALILTGTIALVTALAGGAWHGWREGWIPASVLPAHPRAPLAENFLAVIRVHPELTRQGGQPCVRMPLDTLPGATRGRDGLDYDQVLHLVPGLASVAMARRGDGSLPEGARVLDAMTGFFNAVDGEVPTPEGTRTNGRRWTLTFDGWRRIEPSGCVRLPPPAAVAVESAIREDSFIDGHPVYAVTVTTRHESTPPWLADPVLDRRVHVDARQQLGQPGRATIRLMRTESGWAPAPAAATPPLPTAQTIDALLGREDAPRPRACIMLPHREPGVTLETGSLIFQVEDQAAGTADAYRDARLTMWQSRLSALAAHGVFTETRVPASRATGQASAVRYALNPEFHRWYDPREPGCLEMGDGKPEPIDIAFMPLPQGAPPASREVLGRYALRLAPEAWAIASPLMLPEVAMAREVGGVPMRIVLEWDASASRWTISSGPSVVLIPLATPRPPPAAAMPADTTASTGASAPAANRP